MAGTRWLSEDEQRTWRTFVMATRLLLDQLEQELDEQTEVPSHYYEIVARLAEVPERRLRMSDLADLSESSRGRLSHSIARLESLGWIRREACETDRRGAFAVLTDEGFAALEVAAPVHVEGVRTHSSTNSTLSTSRSCGGSASACSSTWWLSKDCPPKELGRLGMPLQPRS